MRITKPIIKRAHHIIVSDDGDICIGEIPIKSKIIKNPPEWMRIILSKLDGHHTIPRIVKEINSMGYIVSDSEVFELIEKLFNFGLVEESVHLSQVLSSEEIELYDRQLLQFSLIDDEAIGSVKYQEKLKNSRVLILGMGGWGTWCSLQLALSGVGNLKIVDGDKVELSNLNRQVLYTLDDIGENKVDAAERSLNKYNKHITIEKYAEFVTEDESRLNFLLEDIDVVILAWASLGYYRKNTVEEYVHKIAYEKEISVIELGGDPFEISVGPIYPNKNKSKGYLDAKKIVKESFYSRDNNIKKFQEARMKHQFFNGNRIVNAWQSAPSLAIMSGIVVDQVIKLISGYDHTALIGRKISISLRDLHMTEENIFNEKRL